MTGTQLKYIIERSGLRSNDIAVKIGISPQQLNNTFHSPDIKTGLVEKVANVLGIPVSSMYGDTNTQTVNGNVVDSSNVNVYGVNYDALKKRDEHIDRLLAIIERMQHDK